MTHIITGPDTGAANGRRSYRAVSSQRATAVNLGPLQDLPGFWEGTGFSLTARPDFSGGNPDGLFLELNLLRETIEFTTIGSPVMNRGSVQGDIAMYAVTYLHRVTDAITGEALHIEPGLFLNIPATTEPKADASIARLATIPHGTSLCAVGFAQWLITSTERAGGIDNIPFIVSNASPVSLESVFSIETVRSPAGTEYLQLGYSQTALLNFRGLSFPHVTVGTLVKAF
jgi:hypothetical protein